jgi:hypothetical protein
MRFFEYFGVLDDTDVVVVVVDDDDDFVIATAVAT